MKHLLLQRTLPALALSVLALGAARAADTGMSLDLQLGSGKVIDMQSLQWGVGVGISGVTAGGGEREIGRPSMSDLVWTQGLDTTVPLLMSKALSGAITPLAKIDLKASAGAPGDKSFLRLETANSVVTGVSMANDSVSGSMAYNKFTMTYDPQGLGLPGKEATVIYDLNRNRLVSGPTGRAPVSFEGTTPASDGIYLRLGSGPAAIAGESQAMGYENWIQIDSFQMGVGVAVDFGSGGLIVSKPSVSELTFTQRFDATVPVVLADLLRGTNIGQATIEYVTTTDAGPVTFMQLALDDVLFSGLSLSTGGDIPYVSESLNFTSFSQTVWDINADGTRGKSTSFGYDSRGNVDAGTLAANVAGFGTGSLAGSAVSPVPEPQTWLMMLAGLAVLTGAARRRRQG